MKDFTKVLAEMCYYAQEHIGDPHAWNQDLEYRKNLLQCTSYVVACFLAQNTVYGSDGVESNVILDELADVSPWHTEHNNGIVAYDVDYWTTVINRIAENLGGWKRKN